MCGRCGGRNEGRKTKKELLRKEAHSARRKMAAGAAALRRECALSAHFLNDFYRNAVFPFPVKL